MRQRRIMLMMLALGCLATLGLADTFTWTGGGNDDYWDNGDNWESIGGGSYPDDTNDDAIIPYTANGWAVELITEEIDDLSINASVGLSPVGTSATLTVDSLTIGASNAESVITISGSAEIKVE